MAQSIDCFLEGLLQWSLQQAQGTHQFSIITSHALYLPGVAKAFEEDVYPHPDLVALCKQFFGTDDVTNPKLKLAFVSGAFTQTFDITIDTKCVNVCILLFSSFLSHTDSQVFQTTLWC